MSGNPAPAVANGQEATDHAARYEALRAYALDRQAPPSRDGLVVVLRQGIAAWMAAWSQLPASPPRPPQEKRQRPAPLPDEVSAELVRVLAAMTLSHIEELHA